MTTTTDTPERPRWLRVGIGVVLTVVGFLLITRPLTSLITLGVYVAVACFVSGVAEWRRGRLRRVVAIVWIAVGIGVGLALDRAVGLLPVLTAVALVVAGLGRLADVTRGSPSERALAAVWAAVQLAFGLLAVLWPDVTMLVVASLFGIRTVLAGIALVWDALRPDRQPHRHGALARWTAAAAIAVVCAGAWLLSDRLRAGVATVDAFYDTPATVPDQPGRLLRVDAYVGEAPPGATVRRMLYTTTDTHGQPALASALVIAPDGPTSGPVVAWNHGTVGIARTCAPSLTATAATSTAIPGVDQAIANGWVVVATDYTGQGTEGTFPYLIGEGQARSALDGLRAVRELDDLDLSGETVIWGHSQGGHAALWSAAIAPRYAPDLDVAGTVAISPAATPLALAERLVGGDASSLLAVAVSWVLIPYSETYPDVAFNDYVHIAGRALVREMSQRCTTEPGLLVSVVSGLGLSNDVPLYHTRSLAEGPLGVRLAENETSGPFEQPLLLAWGSDDEVIAADLQHAYVADLCRAGVAFEATEYPGYDHMGIVAPDATFIATLVGWTRDRLAEEPPIPTDC